MCHCVHTNKYTHTNRKGREELLKQSKRRPIQSHRDLTVVHRMASFVKSLQKILNDMKFQFTKYRDISHRLMYIFSVCLNCFCWHIWTYTLRFWHSFRWERELRTMEQNIFVCALVRLFTRMVDVVVFCFRFVLFCFWKMKKETTTTETEKNKQISK